MTAWCKLVGVLTWVVGAHTHLGHDHEAHRDTGQQVPLHTSGRTAWQHGVHGACGVQHRMLAWRVLTRAAMVCNACCNNSNRWIVGLCLLPLLLLLLLSHSWKNEVDTKWLHTIKNSLILYVRSHARQGRKAAHQSNRLRSL